VTSFSDSYFHRPVALFIFDKVYIANAGDCRACIYLKPESQNAESKNAKSHVARSQNAKTQVAPSQILQMSHDFSPDADRQRIQMVAYQRPELLRHPVTKEKVSQK